MPDFSNKFDTSKPVGSDLANTLDTITQVDTKSSLNERYGVEHVPLNSSATGFMRVILACESVAMTPSPIESRVMERFSSLVVRASVARAARRASLL